jgi:single-stranded-DNA-specific exonuclease
MATMKNYKLAEEYDSDFDTLLAEYPELMRKLLVRRGIDTKGKAEIFLNPKYSEHTHDPFLIKDMDKAVERILSAIRNGEKIIIYSDYDHDGIPGGVILHDFFKKIAYTNFSNYIPHRHLEGYGLHIEAIENFAKDEVTLLITVDLGSSDVEQVAYANQRGIDVIITDHHITPDVLPNAFAILNSKQPGDTYPDNMLAGSGVAFKLVQGLLIRGNFGLVMGWEKWLLDLAAIGTIADMVPLQGENRVIAKYGLQVLRKSPRLGLGRLLSAMKMQREHITEDDIGFMIAPRINAASRMGEPSLAFDMLATSDEIVADQTTRALEKLNNERKGVVAATVKEIKHTLEKKMAHESLAPIIVLGNPLWSPSLLGLTANSIMESFGKPVFLWGRGGDGETLKGSCRSDGSVDIVALMASIDTDVILQYGGHKMAGGFSVGHERIHLLESALITSYEKMVGVAQEESSITIDGRLLLDQVTWNTYKIVEQQGIKVSAVKRFGKERNHLELAFENSSGRKVVAIGFFMNEESFGLSAIEVGAKIDLIATLEKSMFRNFPELRLRIVDVI